MSTAITSPNTFTQAGSAGLTYSYQLAEDLELVLQDTLGAPIMRFLEAAGVIDLTGSGTDTQRQGILSDVGFQRRFTASGGETNLNGPSGFTLDYWAAAVAQYDLSFTQSIKNNVLGKPGTTVTLETLKAFLPANYLTTYRYLTCVAGAAFSDQTVGSTTAIISADTMYDLAAAISLKLGAQRLGMPVAFFDPVQINQLRDSFRSEPGFIQNVARMEAVQRASSGQSLGDLFGLGFDVEVTDDVVQSGSAYKSFCGSPGSITRIKADPTRARLPAGSSPIYLGEQGIVVYDMMEALNEAQYGWMAVMFGGVAARSATTSLQILINSDA